MLSPRPGRLSCLTGRMASRRDDSSPISLPGLFGTNQDRTLRALRAHRLAMDAVRARAEAKERAERDAELESLRLACEAARQEAVRAARAEAAARARIELVELTRAHERRMAEIRGRGQRGAQLAAAALTVAALCLGGVLGVYFGKIRPENRRVQRAYDELVAAERQRAVETRRMLEQSERRRAELAKELERMRK